MDTLDNIFKETTFYEKFNTYSQELQILAISIDDFEHVKPFNFFRAQPFYTLHHVLRGAGTLFFRKKKYILTAGDYFILPSYENFKYIPNQDNPWKYIGFEFDGYLAKKIFQELYVDSPVITNISQSKSHSVFQNLLSTLSLEKRVNYYSALSCFYSALSLLSQNLINNQKSLSLVENAKQAIDKNFSDPEFDIEKLCKMLHISHSYFCRLFKACTGTTAKKYLVSVRIRESARLLQHSEHLIKEIAEMVGFPNEIHFMKTFKKHVGKTPSEYHLSLYKN